MSRFGATGNPVNQPAVPGSAATVSPIQMAGQDSFQIYEGELNELFTSTARLTAEEGEAVNIGAAERGIEEAKELLEQMSLIEAGSSARFRETLQSKISLFRQRLKSIEQDLVLAKQKRNRHELLGPRAKANDAGDVELGIMSSGSTSETKSQRERLLDSTAGLRNISSRIQESQRSAAQTEQYGNNIIAHLGVQGDRLRNIISSTAQADRDMEQSTRIMRLLSRNLFENRIVSYCVVVALVIIIFLVIWIKFF